MYLVLLDEVSQWVDVLEAAIKFRVRFVQEVKTVAILLSVLHSQQKGRLKVAVWITQKSRYTLVYYGMENSIWLVISFLGISTEARSRNDQDLGKKVSVYV